MGDQRSHPTQETEAIPSMTAISQKAVAATENDVDKIHIEKPGQDVAWEDDHTIVEMMCGLLVFIAENGDTTPAGFDFYHYESGAKATCKACLEAFRT